jgi:hypothetical protein
MMMDMIIDRHDDEYDNTCINKMMDMITHNLQDVGHDAGQENIHVYMNTMMDMISHDAHM